MVMVFFMGVSWPAMALTDYSNQLGYDGLQMARRAGLISREDYVISRLKSRFRPQGEDFGSKSSDGGRGGREITLLLKEAVDYYSTFSAQGREYVDRLLLRPVSTSNEWPWADYFVFYLPETVLTFEPGVSEYPHIGGKYKFWYVTHATPDGEGTVHTVDPAFLYDVVEAFEASYATEVSEMGYTAPLFDADLPDNGGDEKIDVYLMNCGEFGVYGYTVPLNIGSSSTRASYMVVDNDFSEFVTSTKTAEEAMQVTVAHELHHAIQFAINSNTQDWIMEATSTWMESQVYPDIDDNLQYLNGNDGFFYNTDVPLDDDYQWYNSWIWMEYMTIKWGRDSVHDVWGFLETQSNSGLAISNVISQNGSTVKSAFTEFVLKNYSQVGFYDDAAVYDDVTMENAPGQTLDYSGFQTHLVTTTQVYVDHLATAYYKFKPGDRITGENDDSLLIQVYGESGYPLNAAVSVKYTDNSFSEYPLSFDVSNNGYVHVNDFNKTEVNEVVLALVNYSTSPTADDASFWVQGGLGLSISNSENSSSGGCFIESIFGYSN